MELHNPTYNSETNKIVAELNGSRIEIEVDDELREFIEREFLLNAMKPYNPDINPIMDRIDIGIFPYVGGTKYKAKLKQVDKVEITDFDIDVFLASRGLYYEQAVRNTYGSLIGLGDIIKELYELFKNQK